MTESFQSFHEKSLALQAATIKKQLADEWEEMVTGPGTFSPDAMRFADDIRAGKKLPKNHKWVVQKIIRICQDYRLTPDQIDAMLVEITE